MSLNVLNIYDTYFNVITSLTILLFSRMEVCVGMICGTIPTLRPLFSTTVNQRRREAADKYRNLGSPYKLGARNGKAGPAMNSSVTRSGQKNDPTLPTSPSTQDILSPSDLPGIRRKAEPEISSVQQAGSQ